MNKITTSAGPMILVSWLLASVLVFPMAMDSVLGIALLVIVLKRLFGGPAFHFDATDPIWLIASALILYLGASLFWSASWDAEDATQLWLRILLCFCFLIAIAEATVEPEKFLRFFSFLLAMCVLASGVACLIIYFEWPPEDGRIYGLFRVNNAGKVGRIYSVALPFLLAGFFIHTELKRGLIGAAVACSLAVIYLSDTRSAWLAGVIGLLVYAIARWRHDPVKFLWTSAIAGTLVLAALLAFIFHPDPEVTRLLLPRGDSLRLAIWTGSFEKIMSSPSLFGEGYLAESFVQEENQSIRGAHNMYLSTTLQSGFLGLALYTALIVGVALRLLRHFQLPLARLALTLLIMGGVMFLFNGDRLIDKLNVVWFTVWFPVAIAMVAPRMSRQESGTG